MKWNLLKSLADCSAENKNPLTEKSLKQSAGREGETHQRLTSETT